MQTSLGAEIPHDAVNSNTQKSKIELNYKCRVESKSINDFVVLHSTLDNGRRALTYTYLDCLLDVKMRGHKMAEI